MEFYLVINGRTADSESSDPPMSEEGLAEARAFSKRFAKVAGKKPGKEGAAPAIGAIFTCPLLRCIQTSDFLHDMIGTKLRVISGLGDEKQAKEGIDFVLGNSPSKGIALVVTHEGFARAVLSALSLPKQELERCKLYHFKKRDNIWSLQVL